MIKLAIAGCAGRMGQALIQSALQHSNVDLVGGSVSPQSPQKGMDLGGLVGLNPIGVAATEDLAKAFEGADVIIDFTLPDVAIASLDYYLAHQKKVVLGGTGFAPAQQKAIEEAAQSIAMVQGSNMSIGVNLCYQLLAKAAQVLKDFDVDIFEAHHRHKLDAPSGTALAMGQHIAQARGVELDQVAKFDRHHEKQARAKNEIGFASVRVGDIFGDHTVYFASDAERVEITHRASSRQAFSQGALLAALWLQGKSNGLFGMDDVLGFKDS